MHTLSYENLIKSLRSSSFPGRKSFTFYRNLFLGNNCKLFNHPHYKGEVPLLLLPLAGSFLTRYCMRAVIQRVSEASVTIGERVTGRIGQGLLIFIGIEEADHSEDIAWLCGKITRLRVFDDAQGVMNLSVCDVHGGLLVISQFTLHASTKKGNRPSYIRSAKPELAIPLYEEFIRQLETESGIRVETGEFGAMMDVSLVNDGPVTILIDTKDKE
jgi:D-aminoacyl-tRNA deacylase